MWRCGWPTMHKGIAILNLEPLQKIKCWPFLRNYCTHKFKKIFPRILKIEATKIQVRKRPKDGRPQFRSQGSGSGAAMAAAQLAGWHDTTGGSAPRIAPYASLNQSGIECARL